MIRPVCIQSPEWSSIRKDFSAEFHRALGTLFGDPRDVSGSVYHRPCQLDA